MATNWNEENSIQFSDTTLSGVPQVDALLTGSSLHKWGGAVGSGVTITYSFPGNFNGDPSYWAPSYSDTNEPGNMGHLDSTQAAAFTAAFQAWADVAGIVPVQVVDTPTGTNTVGVIRAAFYNAMPGGVGGWSFLPSYPAASGDVWLNPTSDWGSASLAPGGGGFGTMLHELGHALGLTHPLGVATSPAYDASTTVMSYNPHPHGLYRTVTLSGMSYTLTYTYVEPETPMPHDIAAIQYLYGPNLNYHTGDDLYTFDPARPFIRTLWDAGGTDTVSVANFTQDCLIDLRPGHYSSLRIPADPLPLGATESHPNLYDGTDNLAIALDVTIENAVGGSGADTLIGNSAGNVLDGGLGADNLLGGPGSDLYQVDNAGDLITEHLGEGLDTVRSAVTFALPANVEDLTLIGSASLAGTGNALDNVLAGNSGNNALHGGTGIDTASYATATAAVTVNLSLTTAQFTGFGADTLLDIENLIGSAYNDTLTGAAGNNILNGGAGYDAASYANATVAVTVNLTLTGAQNTGFGIDTLVGIEHLIGGAYNDTFTGTAGTSYLNGGAGFDTVRYVNAVGVSVNLALTTAQNTGGGGVDTLRNIEALVGTNANDVLLGSTGNNTLDGYAGHDTVNGNAGDDLLRGGGGNDSLSGGPGLDAFRFDVAPNAASNLDTLTDFSAADDTIQLENAVFAKLTTTGTLAAGHFSATGAATDTNDYVVYHPGTGALYYDADGNGAGAAVQFALLGTTVHPTITAADFVVT